MASVRETHRRFPTGVTVVTTCTDAGPRGLAVNAFSSVSLDPPTVLVCVSRTSRSCEALLRAQAIGINLLAADQADVAQVFASRSEDKFRDVSWHLGPFGTPLLEGTSAHFEVRTTTIAQASTHFVIVGEVVGCGIGSSAPLLYLNGNFHDPAAIDAAAPTREKVTR